MIADKFKKALAEMLQNGEYQKCINNSKFFERMRLKRFRKLILKSGDISQIPIWAILYEIRSTLLLKDIITYMIIQDTK